MESRRIDIGPPTEWVSRMKTVELGPFTIIGKIAEGRGTLLFRAQHDRIGYEVVVKIVKPSHAQNRVTLAEMANEAKVLRRLHHRHVIRLYKFERDAQFPFLILEYISGMNLKQWLVRGERDDNQAPVRILTGLAEGLADVHEAGYVHRDIKSENMLVTASGEVRLIDFALARKVSWKLWDWLRPGRRVQGTRTYMSPEQCLGRSLDYRSDIYSFGVTMYEVITGKPPFYSDDEQALLQDHVSTPPKRPSASVPRVHGDLDRLVMRMLGKRPEDRPGSMHEVVRTLRSFSSILEEDS